MAYSVVILSKDPKNLKHCVQAVRRNEPDLAPERIIVVDDDETGEILSNYHHATVIEGRKPFIFARNANIGLRYAFDEQGVDAAILLNDDAMLSRRRGFGALVSAQRFAPEYGLVASSCNNVGNMNQEPKGATFIRFERRMLCFICVLIPRHTWQTVGPLDEDFTGYGFEDDAYSLAVKRAGYKLGIFDGCYVDHASLKSTFRSETYPQEGFAHNQRVFEAKYGGHH